jgi:hypothetical protein
MRKIMTSSTLKNLPAFRQIDVGCFKIGLGDNGIRRVHHPNAHTTQPPSLTPPKFYRVFKVARKFQKPHRI